MFYNVQHIPYMNSYYRKRREQLLTYKSGANESQIDYVLYMFRRHEELRMKYCKGIQEEVCLTQHRLLWAEVVIKGKKEGLE